MFIEDNISFPNMRPVLHVFEGYQQCKSFATMVVNWTSTACTFRKRGIENIQQWYNNVLGTHKLKALLSTVCLVPAFDSHLDYKAMIIPWTM